MMLLKINNLWRVIVENSWTSFADYLFNNSMMGRWLETGLICAGIALRICFYVNFGKSVSWPGLRSLKVESALISSRNSGSLRI
jgi:hypothetical protein